MQARDYRDIAAGGALCAAGVFAGWHAASSYNLGTIGYMGPGMFPAGVGFILAGLGLMILVPALFRTGAPPQVDWRAAAAVLASIAAFAAVARFFGLIPAAVALTILAVLADGRLGVFRTLLLALGLSLLAYLVFILGLGVPLPPSGGHSDGPCRASRQCRRRSRHGATVRLIL
jgi:hypothetical protein